MVEKKVLVVLRANPFNSVRLSEGLRMSLGLTLRPNAIKVLFTGPSVFALMPSNSMPNDCSKHLSFLKELEIPIYADSESIDEFHLEDLLEGVETVDRTGMKKMLKEAEAVIPY